MTAEPIISDITQLREMCKDGISLHECDLAAAVPGLLDRFETQSPTAATVWIVTYEHRHGEVLNVFATEDAA